MRIIVNAILLFLMISMQKINPPNEAPLKKRPFGGLYPMSCLP